MKPEPPLGGRPVYVIDGSRTPCLKARGRPGPFTAADLAVRAGQPLLARQPFEPGELDQVILGCAIPGPDEANIARVAALRLGCGKAVPAYTVQRNCGSGMQALDSAARAIAAGRSDLILAGGTEAMSHAPVLFSEDMVAWLGAWQKAASPLERLKLLGRLRPAHLAPVIGLLRGLTDPTVGLIMGRTAEVLAWKFGISREAMDAFALRSHQRLARAQAEGRLAEEIEILYDDEGRYHDHDDGVRPDTTLEQLAKLPPIFEREFGLVTAGNSSQVTDGACWLLLASEEAVRRYELPVLGRIVDCAWAGLDPATMGLGPVYASAALLARNGLDLGDIDYWEINEAFAAQVLACLEAFADAGFCRDELGRDRPLGRIDEERLNVAGGAIAVGHPVGMSGARIVLHLLRALAEKQAHLGVATLCIGGGQGGAMLVERRG
ncbi:acetyl-CoA C-acetyltransferase [Methylomarinovum caldicuralii]|uniref:Acetyl-CoA C-acetyltransferase n=1 Tax=Methylomarinovum caldicuralii TaxID=438856 RepID=A0AAU9C6H5_9GAMM|nr:acetyl-CoA C-acetyltransferase [Methylomarinovum caldicuralii]BCX82779.1 acetyl-CoA C-acetyltransferase [Methylomarinovum caldicuralii]